MFLRYIGKRVLQTLIVLFFVSIFAFLLIRMASGNPARMMLPDDATEEQVQQMEIKLGLDIRANRSSAPEEFSSGPFSFQISRLKKRRQGTTHTVPESIEYRRSAAA